MRALVYCLPMLLPSTVFAQDRTPVPGPPAAIRELPRVRSAGSESKKEEDGELRREIWRSAVPAADYLENFRSTGMQGAVDQGEQMLGGGWMPLGPFGDYPNRNGRVAGLQLVPTGGGSYRLYAGACAGGLWWTDSTNMGVWTSIGDGLPNPSVRAFFVDPANPQTIVVGTGDITRWRGGGLFRTTDGGGHWSSIPLEVPYPEAFYRIQPRPGTPSFLLAASSEGILSSSDGGANWSLRQAGHCTDLRWRPGSGQIAWACFSGEGMRRSGDGGFTWSPVTDTDFPGAGDWRRATLATCRDDPDVMAVLVEKDGAVRAVLRTDNGGTDWVDVTGSLAGYGSNQVDHAQALAIAPDDPQRMWLGAIGVAWTTNGGGSWTTSLPHGHDDMTQLHFDPLSGDDVLWMANDGGLYAYSRASGQVSSVNGGATGLNIAQIAYVDADRAIAAIGLQDNGVVRSLDAGQSWQSMHTGDGGYVEITDPETQRLWWTDGIYSTGPAWRSFRKVAGGPTEDFGNPDQNSLNLYHDREGDRLYTAGWTKLYSRDEDTGPADPWALELDLGAGNVPNGVWTMDGSDADGRTLYIAHRDPSGGTPPDLRISVCRRGAGGWSVWHRVLPAAGARKVWSFTPSAQWPGECWAAIDADVGVPKILHTTDFGATWEDLTGNLAGAAVRQVVPQPFDPQTLYAATDFGMFRSVDGGESWQPFQDGLPVAGCFRLRFVVDDSHAAPHRLILATQGRGLWRRDIASAPILYVDAANTSGLEDGTFEHPYDTIGEAVAAAPAGAIVAVRTASYAAPLTVTKNVRIVTWAGTSTVE